jgi:hypothetical protein
MVPADLVLAWGVFGNITDEDIERTIEACTQVCRSGGTHMSSTVAVDEELHSRDARRRAACCDASQDWMPPFGKVGHPILAGFLHARACWLLQRNDQR